MELPKKRVEVFDLLKNELTKKTKIIFCRFIKMNFYKSTKLNHVIKVLKF